MTLLPALAPPRDASGCPILLLPALDLLLPLPYCLTALLTAHHDTLLYMSTCSHQQHAAQSVASMKLVRKHPPIWGPVTPPSPAARWPRCSVGKARAARRHGAGPRHLHAPLQRPRGLVVPRRLVQPVLADKALGSGGAAGREERQAGALDAVRGGVGRRQRPVRTSGQESEEEGMGTWLGPERPGKGQAGTGAACTGSKAHSPGPHQPPLAAPPHLHPLACAAPPGWQPPRW